MSVVAWIAIGASTLLASALLVGLAIARMLGEIARCTSGLSEELWASAPLTGTTGMHGYAPFRPSDLRGAIGAEGRPPRHA